jgi:hypothetical protein
MEKDEGAELSTANEVTVIDARVLECEEKETGLCEKEDDLDDELETAIIRRSKAEFNYARRKELWDQEVKFWYERCREEAASGSGQGFVEYVSIWSQGSQNPGDERGRGGARLRYRFKGGNRSGFEEAS